MKIKTLIVAIAILAVLSVLLFIARKPDAPSTGDARVGRSVIEPSLIDKASQIRITDQGKTVTLRRQSDGSWQVPGYYDLPAEFSKLSQFASNLSEGKIIRLVSSRSDVIARLEFKDAQVALLDDAGKELWSAALGKQADSGGRYVRFGNEQKAYLADLNLWLDTEPKNWANSQLLSLKPDDIAGVEISFAEGKPVALHRSKKEDAWTTTASPEGQRIKTSTVNSLLSTLTSLRFTETAEPNDEKAVAAKPHLRAHKLTTFDGKTYTIALGRVPETKKLKTPSNTDGPPDFTKNLPINKDGSVKPMEPAKPTIPEFETIPAGPVFVTIGCSDDKAPINAFMKKRAFEISDYSLTSLPQKADDLFEAIPAATPPIKPPDPGKPIEDK